MQCWAQTGSTPILISSDFTPVLIQSDFTPILHPNVSPLSCRHDGEKVGGQQLMPTPLPIPDPSGVHPADSRLPLLPVMTWESLNMDVVPSADLPSCSPGTPKP